MAYIKTSWTTTAPRSTSNLSKMETQYDEAVTFGIDLRKSSTEQIRVEVSTTLPAAGTQGRMIFTSTNDTLYADDGTNWRSVGKSPIRSVQYFSGDMTTDVVTVGINSVSTGSTILRVQGAAPSGYLHWWALVVDWVNSTSITVSHAPVGSSGGFYYGSVTEYEPGVVKSLQRDSGNLLTASTYVDFGISAVSTNKTSIYWSYTLPSSNVISYAPALTLTNSTNIRAHLLNHSTKSKLHYQVIEFY